ncbi:hypothetical protein Vafri_19318, partial [Volvox africanus]
VGCIGRSAADAARAAESFRTSAAHGSYCWTPRRRCLHLAGVAAATVLLLSSLMPCFTLAAPPSRTATSPLLLWWWPRLASPHRRSRHPVVLRVLRTAVAIAVLSRSPAAAFAAAAITADPHYSLSISTKCLRLSPLLLLLA